MAKRLIGGDLSEVVTSFTLNSSLFLLDNTWASSPNRRHLGDGLARADNENGCISTADRLTLTSHPSHPLRY